MGDTDTVGPDLRHDSDLLEHLLDVASLSAPGLQMAMASSDLVPLGMDARIRPESPSSDPRLGKLPLSLF